MFKDNNCINQFIFRNINSILFLSTLVYPEVISRGGFIVKFTGTSSFYDLYLLLPFFS